MAKVNLKVDIFKINLYLWVQYRGVYKALGLYLACIRRGTDIDVRYAEVLGNTPILRWPGRWENRSFSPHGVSVPLPRPEFLAFWVGARALGGCPRAVPIGAPTRAPRPTQRWKLRKRSEFPLYPAHGRIMNLPSARP